MYTISLRHVRHVCTWRTAYPSTMYAIRSFHITISLSHVHNVFISCKAYVRHVFILCTPYVFVVHVRPLRHERSVYIDIFTSCLYFIYTTFLRHVHHVFISCTSIALRHVLISPCLYFMYNMSLRHVFISPCFYSMGTMSLRHVSHVLIPCTSFIFIIYAGFLRHERLIYLYIMHTISFRYVRHIFTLCIF